MKKLLVTAIGAAVAFGACAGEISTKRFENEATGTKSVSELPGGSAYWSEGSDTSKSNTYTVGTAGTVSCPLPFNPSSPSQALDIKTTFGKPLSVNIASGGTATNIPSSGVYFDSLVKFTVCEETPTNTYTDAKIVMWLEEKLGGAKNDEVIGTNLMVRAGYLSYNSGALPPVSVTPTNYVCVLDSAIAGDFADQWHRVTIKAIPDITTGAGVPGFAIYIDGSGSELLASVSSTQDKWDSSFTLALNEGAEWLNSYKCLFPSMIQNANKGSLTAASFDGTGSITDIVFTDEPMAFAADYVAPKAIVTIGSGDPVEYGTLAEAVGAVNAVASGTAVTFALSKGMVIDQTLAFASSANVVFDFNGFVLTNNSANVVITNDRLLTITNSVGNGGIYCTSTGGAVVDSGNGALVIAGGFFDGAVNLEDSEDVTVSGGSFRNDTDLEKASGVGTWLAEGKKLVQNQETGLYDVVTDPAYGAVAKIGDDYYQTLKDAVDAATAGQTVAVIADCTVAEAIKFNYGITVSNDYTVTLTAAYALRLANGTSSPVEFCGSGSFVQPNGGTGSPVLVGNNESKATYGESETFSGSLVLNSGTIGIDGSSNNGVKVEYGTFTMNAGTVYGGSRCIKADSDNGEFTSTVTINGGVITAASGKTAIGASQVTGVSTVVINGGNITGTISGAGMVTIPGNSTAQFDRDQTAFCAAGYCTTLSGGWYVVGLANYTINYLNEDGTAFTDWAEYVPTTSYTIEDAVTLPTSSDVQLGLGVEFGGWTNETGTVTGWAAGEKTGNVTVYAKLNPIVPSGLDPASGTTNVTVTAANEADAIAAAKSAITVPTGSGATAADYANLFNYSATAGSVSGTYDVAITGIKDEVVAAVNADAVGVFSGDTSVSIPAGLYYRVTPSTALPISGTPATGLSNGSITVTKPGSTQGFIKVELSSGSF